MAYPGRNVVFTPNEYGADAFGGIRVSQPFSLLDWTWKYSVDALEWETSLAGSGLATHLPDESSVRLSVSTANADRVRMRSNTHYRYQAGKGLRVLQTLVHADVGQTNQTRRWGLFNDNDGLFWELSATTLRIVRRTSTSGSPVDNATAQSSWNVDKLDGTGISGVTLDLTKGNIYEMDLQWLGVGTVRFFVNGILVHEMANANTYTVPYIKTAVLPLQYEVVNTGASTASNMKAICCAVRVEGGEGPPEYSFAAFNAADVTVGTTEIPVLSIRPAATFNSIENRMLILPRILTVSSEGNRAGYRLVIGGALTGASWSAADANSGVERDSSATVLTGGTTLIRGFLPNTNEQAIVYLEQMFNHHARKLCLSAFGTAPILTVMMVNEAAAGNTSGRASLTWGEVR